MRNSTHIITTAAIAMLVASSLFAQDDVAITSQISLCGHAADCGASESESGCAVPDDSCGRHCDDCDKCCFEPTWEFRGGWLMLRRDIRGTGTAASLGAGEVLSTVNQYDTNYSSGFELNARRRFDARVVELNYFQVDSFRATVTGASSNGPFVSDYDSALYNFEANVLSDTGSPLRLLAGFRYIAYNDVLDQQTTNIYSALTVNNDLFGGQVGGELDLYPFNRYDGLFHLRAFAKFGIFGQQSSASSILLFNGGSLPVAGSSHNDTTLLSEAGITGGIQVAPAVTIDWGYRVLYFDGIATAGDTVTSSNVGGGTTTVDTGSILFHGFTLSTTLTY